MIGLNKQRSQSRREISAQEQGPLLKILIEDPRGAYHREINVLDKMTAVWGSLVFSR